MSEYNNNSTITERTQLQFSLLHVFDAAKVKMQQYAKKILNYVNKTGRDYSTW